MISDSQFWCYLNAQREIEEAERIYQAERKEAYSNISPTMTGYDIGSGRLYKLGCDVEGTAIYLVELNEKRLERIQQVKKKAEILEEGLTLLYDDERAQYEEWKTNPNTFYLPVFETLKECVSYVLEQQQKPEQTQEEITVDEWDRQIEEMSEEELLQDYWDKDGSFDECLMKRRKLVRQYGIVELSKKVKNKLKM